MRQGHMILKSLGFSNNGEKIFSCHIQIASSLGDRIWVGISLYLPSSKALSNHFHLEMAMPSWVTWPEPNCGE